MAGFGAHSTAEEVLRGTDLSNVRVLITGISSGIGLETARALLSRGAQVVGTARNMERAHGVAHDLDPAGRLRVMRLDLASLSGVREFADALVREGDRFDVIIANAGVMACPFERTDEGFELQLASNYLGHFVLLNRLASHINQGGRVVSLSSVAHRLANVDLSDPNFDHTPYRAFAAYGQSKTACSLFAVEFDRRHRGRGVRGVTVNPGAIYETGLARHMNADLVEEAKEMGSGPVAPKNTQQGAATSVWAGFVAPVAKVAAGYCEDCDLAPVNDSNSPFSGVRSYAIDPQLAKAWWAKTEELVGECSRVRD